jgi:hypothetical protein
MPLIRVRLRGWAASTIEVYSSERWAEDAPEIEAVCNAYRAGAGSHLVVDASSALLVVEGLICLCNSEDEEAEREARIPAERRDPSRLRLLRAAAGGLSTLALKVARATEDLRG